MSSDPNDRNLNEPLLQLFRYDHLPPNLRDVSRLFCDVAWQIVQTIPASQERTASLRKLREAKDAAITAVLWDPSYKPDHDAYVES